MTFPPAPARPAAPPPTEWRTDLGYAVLNAAAAKASLVEVRLFTFGAIECAAEALVTGANALGFAVRAGWRRAREGRS